jgi:hypothetical protein
VRPVTFVLGGLAVLVSLGVAIVLYRAYGQAEVGFGPRGYTVESDALVRVVFDVDKPAGATALCTVRARDRFGEEAGSALVTVGPSARRQQTVTYDLATRARANTGEITDCTLAPATGRSGTPGQAGG